MSLKELNSDQLFLVAGLVSRALEKSRARERTGQRQFRSSKVLAHAEDAIRTREAQQSLVFLHVEHAKEPEYARAMAVSN